MMALGSDVTPPHVPALNFKPQSTPLYERFAHGFPVIVGWLVVAAGSQQEQRRRSRYPDATDHAFVRSIPRRFNGNRPTQSVVTVQVGRQVRKLSRNYLWAFNPGERPASGATIDRRFFQATVTQAEGDLAENAQAATLEARNK